eukprot:CAMPEP_0114401502 /NCGR_PEP_ID=MMETSP0102-20121206/17264_1 /TAXON_ID=38822 ORGANISM="Pteridomonas danica, Strain PT" /NCGR_SAMPLE_ID=MMETSP0102 /ASSEMBLY_ACC=CAM_ASM_000212 /LENGTH=35 /DNA_ID= /DNA_START= /DNA_END= /DNA_ORIENTATION=
MVVGSGGSGKSTLVATAISSCDEIKERFESIVWLS